jgi:hypothetical protein
VSDPLVQALDGVGIACRGNLALIVYAADARLHRTRWLFDRMDELAARSPGGIVGLMIIAPHAGPPDGPTRRENSARLKVLGAKLRLLGTVALGDDFKVSIVRTVMRAMVMLSGQSARQFVATTEDEGIDRMLAGTDLDPGIGRAEIRADLAAVRVMLESKLAA